MAQYGIVFSHHVIDGVPLAALSFVEFDTDDGYVEGDTYIADHHRGLMPAAEAVALAAELNAAHEDGTLLDPYGWRFVHLEPAVESGWFF